MITTELQTYIENNIFPEYNKNDLGHNIDHINYVITRSLNFAKTIKDINLDMVYTIASYHDIGHHIDKDKHEKISADILFKDKYLQHFFTQEQLKIMAEAIIDHRSTLDRIPRSIYGEIVSSADRNTSVELLLKRTYQYRLKHYYNLTTDEIIEDARLFILKKFGKNGYANNKMYFEDKEYQDYLRDIRKLAENKEQFKKKFIEVNNIEKDY